MRKQKRYTTEKQILDKIESYKNQAKECLEKADALDREYKERLLAGNVDMGTTIDAKAESERLYKRRIRIEECALPKLKEALAEFNTMLLPITDDPGVVIH